MLRRYILFVVRHRLPVILTCVLISVGLATQIGSLKVVVDPQDQLPQQHPYVQASNRIEDIFGGINLVVIGIESMAGDVYQPAVLEKIRRMTNRIFEIPGVIRSNVLSLAARKAKNIIGLKDGMQVRPLMENVPHMQDSIQALKSAVSANPIYLDSIVSRDGTMAVIVADFKFGQSLPGYRAIKNQIEALVNHERDEQVRIYLGGPAINLAWMEIYSERVIYLVLIALGVIMAVLYLSFRSLQGMLIPVLTAILSMTLALGLMGLLQIPLDTFNVATPILILTIGAGHSVQILKRYYEEYNRIQDNSLAVIESLSKVGPVMLTAGCVAIVSFLALTVFPTSTIRVFGLLTAAGIASAISLEMSFVPACRSLLAAPKQYETEREDVRGWIYVLLERVAGLISGQRWSLIFLPLAGVILLCFWGITQLKVDNSMKENFSEDSAVRQDDRLLNAKTGGTNTLYVLIEGPHVDAIKAPDVLKAMEPIQSFLESHSGIVGKTLSLTDFVRRMNKAMHADDPAYEIVPDNRDLIAQYLLLYSMSGDTGDFDSYVDYEYRVAVVRAFLKTDSTATIERLINNLRPILAKEFPSGFDVSIGGSVAQSAALNEVIVQGKLLNIAVIAFSVYLISSLVLRSPAGGFFVLLPLALTVLANFGLMGLLGIRLEISTATVSAMAVGIGADYAIYIICRLREEIQRGIAEEQALHTTLTTAGKAVVFVAMAVGLGYMVVIFSGFALHQRLGCLIAAAMAVSCVASITVLPALLYLVRPRFVFSPSIPISLESKTNLSTT